MYIEFDGQLINSIYFGKVEKLDKTESGTTTYSLIYELINGTKYIKDFDSQTDRDDEYEELEQSEGSGTSISYSSSDETIVATNS